VRRLIVHLKGATMSCNCSKKDVCSKCYSHICDRTVAGKCYVDEHYRKDGKLICKKCEKAPKKNFLDEYMKNSKKGRYTIIKRR